MTGGLLVPAYSHETCKAQNLTDALYFVKEIDVLTAITFVRSNIQFILNEGARLNPNLKH